MHLLFGTPLGKMSPDNFGWAYYYAATPENVPSPFPDTFSRGNNFRWGGASGMRRRWQRGRCAVGIGREGIGGVDGGHGECGGRAPEAPPLPGRRSTPTLRGGRMMGSDEG